MMANRTIASLAFLKVTWDHLEIDFVESFVPLVAMLIKKRNYEEVEVISFCQDFQEEFGLIIPYHPMITILNRTRKRGFIQRGAGKFTPNRKKIDEESSKFSSSEQERKFRKVLDEFIKFTKNNYNVALSKDEAEAAFLIYLRSHDLDILFESQEKSILPAVKFSLQNKFLVYSFIKHTYESEPELFRFVTDIAVGHVLASALLYSGFEKYKGRLNKLCFCLDTGFILRFIGIDGEEIKKASQELLESLREQKAKLLLFRNTYEEIIGILERCLKWIGH